MNYAIKKVKYYASLSQETPCYTADLYRDGKMIGTVENRGGGGADMFRPSNGFSYIDGPSEDITTELMSDYLAQKEAKQLLKKKGLVFMETSSADSIRTVSGIPHDKLVEYVSGKYPNAVILTGKTPESVAKILRGKI